MGRPHMTKAQRAECIKMYLEGFTLHELACIYDRHRTIIERLIQRTGVQRGHLFRLKRREINDDTHT